LLKWGVIARVFISNSFLKTTERRVKVMEINVSFDEQGRVRVLDADKYEQTKQLQDQCSGFSASTFLMVVG
jgi:hypothetical protein